MKNEMTRKQKRLEKIVAELRRYPTLATSDTVTALVNAAASAVIEENNELYPSDAFARAHYNRGAKALQRTIKAALKGKV